MGLCPLSLARLLIAKHFMGLKCSSTVSYLELFVSLSFKYSPTLHALLGSPFIDIGSEVNDD